MGAGLAPLDGVGRGPDWLLDALHGDDVVPDRTLPLLPYLDNPLPLHWAVTTAGVWEVAPFAWPEEARAELATRFGLQPGPAPVEVTPDSIFD